MKNISERGINMGTEAIFNTQDIIKINHETIERLQTIAESNTRKRARICLHKSPDDLLHEMIICIKKGQYIPPHLHMDKTESNHMITGEMLVFVFDDEGNVIEKFKLSDNRESLSNLVFRIEKKYYHTIVPITDYVIFHEVNKGPFLGNSENKIPEWAPKEGDLKSIESFYQKLGVKLDLL